VPGSSAYPVALASGGTKSPAPCPGGVNGAATHCGRARRRRGSHRAGQAEVDSARRADSVRIAQGAKTRRGRSSARAAAIIA